MFFTSILAVFPHSRVTRGFSSVYFGAFLDVSLGFWLILSGNTAHLLIDQRHLID